jgi:hypothetical protein
MRTFTTSRRRAAPLLLVALGLSAVAVPATAQESGLEVECELPADHEEPYGFGDYFIDEDDDLVYFLVGSTDLECTGTGLDPEGGEATWSAEFFDLEADDVVVAQILDEPLTVEADGTAAFAIPVPLEPSALWMNAWVTQGAEEVVFYGSTIWQGGLECEPDPVTEGETVTCSAEEMILREQEYWWWVVFLDEDGDEVDVIEDGWEADASGRGTFTFDVPAGEGIVGYEAVVEQELYVAWFDGQVEAAGAPEPPEPTASPTPTPTAS